jgi:flagellin
VTNTITVSDTSTLNNLTISGVTITVNSSGELVATAATGGFANAVNGLTLTVKDSEGNIKTPASSALSSFTETRAAADLQAEGRATFHIGANTDQNIQLAISDMRALALGVNDLKIAERDQANVAIKVIDAATQKVSAQRSALGAVQNRLEHTINNLGAASENLSAAESRIRDVDMAKEMMEYTKNSILTQAAQAMLAQANQQPQGVLQLLR